VNQSLRHPVVKRPPGDARVNGRGMNMYKACVFPARLAVVYKGGGDHINLLNAIRKPTTGHRLENDFRTKAYGLAGQLLREHLQTGFEKPARVLCRTVWTLGKGKLSDFSLVVDYYCERQEIAGLFEG